MFSQEQAAKVAEAWIRAGEQPRPGQPVAPLATAFTVALSREAGSGGAFVAREVGRREDLGLAGDGNCRRKIGLRQRWGCEQGSRNERGGQRYALLHRVHFSGT